MNMPHNSTHARVATAEQYESELHQARIRKQLESFFLILILVVGSIGFSYVMSQDAYADQSIQRTNELNQETIAAFAENI